MNPARAFGPAAVSGYLMENAGTHAVSIVATPCTTNNAINTSFFTQHEIIIGYKSRVCWLIKFSGFCRE